MKNVFTLLFALLCLPTLVLAQINTESPYPVDVEVLTPSSISGSYDYGTQTQNADDPIIWGPELSETVSGELVWAYNQVDSLGCSELDDMGNVIGGPIINDVDGKIALIRRGLCDFGEKVANAEVAGAIGVVIVNHYDNADDTGATLVGMLGGTTWADQVTIPAVFIGRSSGEMILSELDAGNPVTMSFTVQSFYDPISSYSHQTPLSDAIEMDVFQINYINGNPTDAVDVTITATIAAPSGATETFTGASNVAALADSIVEVSGSYLPTEMGEHTITWSNDLTPETLTSTFEMTEYTYGLDDTEIGFSAQPTADDFVNASLVYQVGGLVLVDGDGAVATHASFGIANAADLYTGDPDADNVVVILYDADVDNNGTIDFPAGGTFNDLTEVAFGAYEITGNEQPGTLVDVALEDFSGSGLVDLKPDGAYYISILYDGTLAGTGVAPSFVASNTQNYLNFPSTPLFLDQLYTGWNSRIVAVRLQLEGYVPMVGTNDIAFLDDSKLSIAPNPATDVLNIDFELEEMASEVQVNVLDLTGRVIQRSTMNNVLQGTHPLNVSALPVGSYILYVQTPEGNKAKKFMKF